jgi:hypothetical protein
MLRCRVVACACFINCLSNRAICMFHVCSVPTVYTRQRKHCDAVRFGQLRGHSG